MEEFNAQLLLGCNGSSSSEKVVRLVELLDPAGRTFVASAVFVLSNRIDFDELLSIPPPTFNVCVLLREEELTLFLKDSSNAN